MSPAQKLAIKRKAERLVRLAYNLEAEASAFRALGLSTEADWINGLASDIGKAGRSFRNQGEQS